MSKISFTCPNCGQKYQGSLSDLSKYFRVIPIWRSSVDYPQEGIELRSGAEFYFRFVCRVCNFRFAFAE